MTGAPLGAGRLIGRSLRLLVRHFAFLFPLAFAPSLALALLNYGLFDPADMVAGAAPVVTPGGLAVVFANVAVSFVVTGVMCLAALDVAIGKRHSVRDYLAQTLAHIGPIVALGLLLAVATGLGFVLLFLPGLYIFARYLPWAPAILFENAGWGGLGRAQALTEGYRWPLAGAALLMGLLVGGSVLLLSPLLTAAGGSGWAAALFEAAFGGVYYALSALFTALAYLRLREVREGATVLDVAASID